MAKTSRAAAHWSGDLTSGGGAVTASTSGILSEQPTSWQARTEDVGSGRTNPEELLASALAACFSMAVSNELSKAGHVPERVDVSVDVSADKREAGWTVISAAITLRANVPGVDEETFREQAEKARGGCPISRAIAGNVEVTLDATLQG